MNNDYLWDKKGSDPEIEGLENLLADLRYQPTPPPSIVQKQLVFEPKRSWFAFSFARLAAAGTVFGALLLAIWIAMPGSETSRIAVSAPPAIEDPQGSRPETDSLSLAPQTTEKKEDKVSPMAPLKTLYRPERDYTKRSVPAAARVRKQKRNVDSLTAEEKYAYDQLMLALSITSSKLKAVNDTINRAED